MAAELWLGYAAVAVVLLLVSACMIKYFEDRFDSDNVTTVVSIFGVFFGLSCVFLLPADVYGLSLTNTDDISQVIKVFYYIFFGIIVAYTFVLIPFAYFYYEADDLNATVKSKAISAAKYTFVFMLGAVLLIIVGLIIELGEKGDEDYAKWIQPLLDMQSDGEMAFKFVMGAIICLGLLSWFSLTSRGLAVSSLSLFITSSALSKAARDRAMYDRFSSRGSHRPETDSDTTMSESLLSSEDRTSSYPPPSAPSASSAPSSGASRVRKGPWRNCWWAKAGLGIVTLAFSTLLVASLLISSVDKMAHGEYKKGFLLDKPTWLTPIDRLLLAASHVFPLDYVILGFVAAYILSITLLAIYRYGNRWLCVYVYALDPHASCPQALLLTTLNVIYVALVLMASMLTLSPRYAAFGHQEYYDIWTNQTLPCTMEQVNMTIISAEDCRLTQLALFFYTTTTQVPFLGLAFAVGEWAFILGFFFWAYWYLHWEEDISYNFRQKRQLHQVDV